MTSPAQAAANWLAAMQSSKVQSAYVAATGAITESPMAKAAMQLDKMLARLTDAVTSGRMAAALNSTPLEKYKQGCAKKASALGTGAQLAKPKVDQATAKWIPIMAQAQQTIAAMPSGTSQASKDRATRWIELMQQAAGTAT